MADPTGERPTAIDPVDAPPAAGERPPEEGTALSLSGGGSRALLFHVGVLWRINELGLLPTLRRVSGVSGGSIATAVLGMAWPQLAFRDGVATAFDGQVVDPIRRFTSRTTDVPVFLRGMLLRGSVADTLERAFARGLFGDRTLQDLPEEVKGPPNVPRFVINASNLQSTAVFRFSREYAADQRVGRIDRPTFPLARVVAASCAFPPFFGPLRLDLSGAAVTDQPGADLHRPPYTQRALLVDGGVYDNLGLETTFKRFTTLLVSNGGGHTSADPAPPTDWARQTLRVMHLLDGQVRSLRARMLLHAFTSRPPERRGAYWAIRGEIGEYGVADALPCPSAATQRLASLPTRLAAVDRRTQEQLINWGYAITDAALRRHVVPDAAPPQRFPYPGGVG